MQENKIKRNQRKEWG